jgi:hypothetical protein
MCAVFQDQTAVGQFLIQTGADLSLTEYKVRGMPYNLST